MTTFAERLLMLRKERGFSLRELEERSDIAAQNWNHWEHGLTSPHVVRLEQIAGAFNLTVPELLEPVYARDEPPFPLAV